MHICESNLWLSVNKITDVSQLAAPPPSLCAVYVLNILFLNVYFLHKRINMLNKHFYQAAIIACRLLFTDSIYF